MAGSPIISSTMTRPSRSRTGAGQPMRRTISATSYSVPWASRSTGRAARMPTPDPTWRCPKETWRPSGWHACGASPIIAGGDATVDSWTADAIDSAFNEGEPGSISRRADPGRNGGFSVELGDGWTADLVADEDVGLGLALRGWSVDADLRDVFSVVSDEHTISFFSGSGDLEMYLYSKGSTVMPYDGWSMPDPGYWFWDGLLRVLLLRDWSVLTEDGGLAFDFPDMRMSVRPVDQGRRRYTDRPELRVAMEALYDRRTRWRLRLDGFLSEDGGGMPCLRSFGDTVMRFDIPDYALERFASENPLPDCSEWMYGHQWTGFSSGILALKDALERALGKKEGDRSRL